MKLLIVDDHPVLREGLTALIGQGLPDAEILQAVDPVTALDAIQCHPGLDAVILDLMLPGIGGFGTISELKRLRPDLPVIVLSSSENPRDARKAFDLGALGYVPKSASRDTLVLAIKLVLSGGLYVPPLLLDGVGARAAPAALPMLACERPRLTERQVAVLSLLSAGYSNKLIADRLNMAEKTVKAHVGAIFKALNVVNRTQAATAGRETGLV